MTLLGVHALLGINQRAIFAHYNHPMQVNINSKANRTVIVKLLALSLMAITPALFIYVSYLLISL